MSTSSGVQDVRPSVLHRGVNIDGSERSPAPLGFMIAGNPFEQEWGAQSRMADIRLDTGAWTPAIVDLALPSPGFSWTIGRSYNSRQETSGGAHHDSNGAQGRNWFQDSQPEMVRHDADGNPATKGAGDRLYLVYTASAFIEFARIVDNSGPTDFFRAVNGAAGAVHHQVASSEADTYTYYDRRGAQAIFWGFDDPDIADAKEGQLWKILDPSGASAYVGDPSNKATALSSGYNAAGQIVLAFDPKGRRYEYTYGGGRLTQVAVSEFSGSWVATGDLVEYEYYGASEAHGSPGDLKLVTVSRPTSDASRTIVEKTHYRYYKGSYVWDPGEPGHNPGRDHAVKLVLGPEGARNFDWGSGAGEPALDEDFLNASDEDLKPYARLFVEYHADTGGYHRQLRTAFLNGECGCAGGINGTFSFDYEINALYSNAPGYDQEWWARTIVQPPAVDWPTEPAAWITQYFDEAAQPMHRIESAGDPALAEQKHWAKKVDRDAAGRVVGFHWPKNCITYVHDNDSDWELTTSATIGLARTYTRVSSGDMTGFLEAARWHEGDGGDKYFETRYEYSAATYTPTAGLVITRPFLFRSDEYTELTTTGSSGYNRTEHVYTFWTSGAALVPKQVQTKHPVVTVDRNGSGSQSSSYEYIRTDGTTAFTRAEDGVFTYTRYADGLLVMEIADAQTNSAVFGAGDDPSGVWGISESGAGLHRITGHAYDGQGRPTSTTHPDSRVAESFYTRLDDGRPAVLSSPRAVAGSPTTRDGPVEYRVLNLEGQPEFIGLIALTGGQSTTPFTSWISGGGATDDPLEALNSSVGAVTRLTTHVYSSTGIRELEKRVYHAVPGSTGYLPGTVKTNFDATRYGYDNLGRRDRVTSPCGTIVRKQFDARGNPISASMGTEEPTLAPNMRDIWVRSYDGSGGGSDGSGDGAMTDSDCMIIAEALLGQSTTLYRDTRDFVIVASNPTAPHVLYKRDNLGRPIAVGLYSSDGGLDLASDPTTLATDRVALVEFSYDQRGRRWRTVHRKIDATDGSIVPNGEITESSWFDETGRTLKRYGRLIEKFAYDGLGRVSRRYVLSKDDDAAAGDPYAATKNVVGDILLEEHQTTYATNTDDVILSAIISRFHGDYGGSQTTGALDTNADADPLKLTAADLKGRAYISAKWYDALHRLRTIAEYGTNGGSTFDRATVSEPSSSSANVLVSKYAHDGVDALESVTDPGGVVTKYEYDHAGRTTKITENYVDGSPGGGTNNDQDIITRFEFAYPSSGAGLIRRITVDRAGSSDDQQTTYTYGTEISSGGSALATGHLLREIQYPDSSGGGDVFSVAYAHHQKPKWVMDQAGNKISFDYDQSGREISRTVLAVASGFDARVRSIETSYTALGAVSRVSQRDAAATVVDEVEFTYDGWGKVVKFEQDPDSAIGAGIGRDAYDVEYTYERTNSGVNTVRRTGMTLPASTQVNYHYLSTSGRHDNDASRVSRITVSRGVAVTAAEYEYLGIDHAVEVELPQASVYTRAYGSTAGSYPRLDRFNRAIKDVWVKTTLSPSQPTTAFYETDFAFDARGNVTLSNDHVHSSAFDMKLTLDSVSRLLRAQQGNWSTGTSSFVSVSSDEAWELGTTANWIRHRLDLNGDGVYTGLGELNENNPDTSGSTPVNFGKSNEQLGRDVNNDGTNDYTLAHDSVGNLTDDGVNYLYKYDVFGRLVEIKSRASGKVVTEYRYNGLGHRIGWHYDVDADGTLESTSHDPWYWFLHDETWCVAATFRGDDAHPKEIFVRHAAGRDGMGESLHIDETLLRDRDVTAGWSGAADGTPEERVYICHNRRHDVVALLTAAGAQIEQVRYSAYGVPFGLCAGDVDGDGDVDATDTAAIQAWITSSKYDVRGDLDLDGDVDLADKAKATGLIGAMLGRGVLTRKDVGNRLGYTGFQWDPNVQRYFARFRVYAPELGRFLNHDPAEYFEGYNLYLYGMANPLTRIDPMGLWPGWLDDWRRDFREGWEEVKDTWKEIVKSPNPGSKFREYAQDPEGIQDMRDALCVCENIPGADVILTPIQTTLDLIDPNGGIGAACQTAVCSIAPGSSGNQVKQGIKAVPLHRPYLRKDTIDGLKSKTPKNKQGKPIDPHTRKPIKGTPDIGHKPGHEFWREKQKAEAECLSQAEFNDRMNNPDYYWLEDPHENRSHKHEKPRKKKK